MRRTPVLMLLACLVTTGELSAQILDRTLVPRGQLRLQAHPVFTRWDSRYGRALDGTESEESLSDDLSDADGSMLFPGLITQRSMLESATGTTGYTAGIGSTSGRMTKDVTRVEFGGHLGVTDWLTVGVLVPWTQTRTAADLSFAPDSTALGLSPRLTNGSAVDGYLAALSAAALAAQSNAATVCGGGGGAACTAAQSLSDRMTSFSASVSGAYGAAPFFPLAGSTMAGSLTSASATLDSDLTAAGLAPIGAVPVFAADALDADGLVEAQTMPGGGIEGFPLVTRRRLWQVGDAEVSVLARVMELEGPTSLTVLAGGVVRLPTGFTEDPDVFFDLGTGDRQTDVEIQGAAFVHRGRFGFAVGGRYAVQRPTTVVKRVAPVETAFPALATRQELTWEPASYLGLDAAPYLRLTDELWLTTGYRYFQKGRDVFSLVDPTSGLDPTVLAWETGVKLHQIEYGLRYDTVERWAAGEAPRPLEIHLRVVQATAGSGGQTPVSTRIEAGLRLFRRFWGPEPGSD